MSDVRELGLVALDEREAAKIEGGARTLGPIIIICEIPPFPLPLPLPTRPLFGVS
jgi:hypothetical protein